MKPKKRERLLGPVTVALVVFAFGCAVMLIGLSSGRGGLMLLGGMLMGVSGGVAALLGEGMNAELSKSRGGAPARRAREEAERRADESSSDLTVPEDWVEPPTPGG